MDAITETYNLICKRARCNFISLSPVFNFLEGHLLDGSTRYLCKTGGVETNYIDASSISDLMHDELKSAILKILLEACKDCEVAVLMSEHGSLRDKQVFLRKGTTLEQLLLERDLGDIP
jgi:hypothetical protein